MRSLATFDLGIYAPYTWDDVTYLACGLCDTMENLGGTVRYMSCQTHDKNVHFRYDKAVSNGKRVAFRPWAEQCRNMLWFDVQPSKLDIAKRAGCRNLLVPLLHRLEPQDFEVMPRFDDVLCVSQTIQDVLGRKAPRVDSERLDWDSCLPLASKSRSREEKDIHLFAPIDSATARDEGVLYADIFRILLDALPRLSITICATRYWRRPTLSAFCSLKDRFEDRMILLRKPDHFKRMEAYRTADWVFCGSLHESSLLAPTEALAFGCPIIAFNAPPINEMVQHLHNGYLIPCGTSRTAMGIPRIQVNAKELLDTLLASVGDPGVLMAMQQQPWPELEERKRNFLSRWRQLLVLEEQPVRDD